MKILKTKSYLVSYPTGYSDVISGFDLFGKYHWIYQLIQVGYAKAELIKENK